MSYVIAIIVIATSGPPQLWHSNQLFPSPALCEDRLPEVKREFAMRFEGAIIRGRCEPVLEETGA